MVFLVQVTDLADSLFCSSAKRRKHIRKTHIDDYRVDPSNELDVGPDGRLHMHAAKSPASRP
jgi:hypothetical protein